MAEKDGSAARAAGLKGWSDAAEGLKDVVPQTVRRPGSVEKTRDAQPLCIMLVRIEKQRVVLFEDCDAASFLAPGPALGRCEHNPQ